MGKMFPVFLLSIPLLASASMVRGAEVTACIVDMDIPNNPVYYYLPTVGSKLRCELDRADYHPTLQELYRDGWRVVAVVDPKVKNRPGSPNERPSAVFYMERAGVAADAASGGATEQPKSSGGFLKGIF